MKKFKEIELPDIPATTHQIDRFTFSKQLCESSMHCFCAPLLKEFIFLQYNEAKDVVFCHLCDWILPKKLKGDNAELSYVNLLNSGFPTVI